METTKGDAPVGRKLELEPLFLRWSTVGDSEFRQYTARRTDHVKLLAGGLGTGLLSIVVFLTSNYAKSTPGFQTFALISAAKVCWAIFGFGITAISLAYWNVQILERRMEDILKALRLGKTFDDSVVQELLTQIKNLSTKVGKFVYFALRCLLVGWALVFCGVLFL